MPKEANYHVLKRPDGWAANYSRPVADSPDSSPSQKTPDWLDAWGALWMRGFFGRFPEAVDADGVFFCFVTLARAQAGAEHAYEQLEVAMADNAHAEGEADWSAATKAKLRMSFYMHAFAVEADLLFDTLQRLGSYLPRDAAEEVKQTRRMHQSTATNVGRLRNHVEHLPERIHQGRRGRRPMTREVFRQAVGVFEGTTVVFGNEEFDLREIRDALRRVEERTAPRLEERLKAKLKASRKSPT